MTLTIYQPDGRLLGHLGDITFVSPRSLLRPSRLDIAVKLVYARHLRGYRAFLATTDCEVLYSSHIHARTQGIEPNAYYRKTSTEDYRFYFREILNDIEKNGFDPDDPVLVSSRTGLILNGAHRVAASLALDLKEIPVRFDSNATGREWDLNWFLRAGFSTHELTEIALTYSHYSSRINNIAIAWGLDEIDHQEIIHMIRKRSDLYFLNRIDPGSNLRELVYDVYTHDNGLNLPDSAPNIKEKADRLCQNQDKRVSIIGFETECWDSSITVRNDVREKFANTVKAKNFDILHTATNTSELNALRRIALSPPTLRSYINRKPLDRKFIEMLKELKSCCSELNIPFGDVVIVGGAVFELFGVKKADDIDIVVPYSIRRRIASDKAVSLSSVVDLACYGYARSPGKGLEWTDNELSASPDLYVVARGVKFATFETVMKRKRFSFSKEKNRRDIQSLREAQLGVSLEASENYDIPIPEKRGTSFLEALRLALESHSNGWLHISAQYYRIIAEEWPSKSEGWTGLGICALQRGDVQVAVSHFNKAKECGGRIAKWYLKEITRKETKINEE